MVFLQFGQEFLKVEIPNGVMVPKVITRIINMGLSPLQIQGLVFVPIPNGEMMWVCPDIIEGGEWTTIVSMKIKEWRKI